MDRNLKQGMRSAVFTRIRYRKMLLLFWRIFDWWLSIKKVVVLTMAFLGSWCRATPKQSISPKKRFNSKFEGFSKMSKFISHAQLNQILTKCTKKYLVLAKPITKIQCLAWISLFLNAKKRKYRRPNSKSKKSSRQKSILVAERMPMEIRISTEHLKILFLMSN